MEPRAGPPPIAPVRGERQQVGDTFVRPFGKYYLVRKLAEGGMAEIFLAKQVGVEGFERNIVIKRMLAHLSQVPDFVSMFLDEARLATQLEHPNIVAINDLGLADGCYYIAMEYLPGEDFSTVIRTAARRREYVPLMVTLRVIADAARGLHFAHSFTDSKGKPLNIVHRDISPSNIFVTYTGQVKVLDFGIAKAESRLTNTTAGVVKGKYQYMAPEQAVGDRPIDRRADVFSLGVSLYEALTNTRPFARDTDLAILNAVLRGEFRPLHELRPDLSGELEQIVRKAMSGLVDERYQTADDFAQDLERYLQAHTSGGGTSSLGNFMTSFFGPERVQSKTRIDSLAELAQQGVDVPGHSNPRAPKTDPDHTPTTVEVATKAALPPGVVAEPLGPGASTQVRQATRKGLLLGVGGAFALSLAVGAAVVVLVRQGGETAADPVPVADARAEVDAGPAAAPGAAVVDPSAGGPDAGAVAVVEPGVEPPKPRPAPPGILTERGILAVVRQNYGGLARCVTQHEADLPGQAGLVKLRLTIASSGRVTQASSEHGDKDVGRCLEEHARTLKFPAHRDREVSIVLPVQYTKK